MKLQEILSKYTPHTFGNSPKMYNEQQVLAIVREITESDLQIKIPKIQGFDNFSTPPTEQEDDSFWRETQRVVDQPLEWIEVFKIQSECRKRGYSELQLGSILSNRFTITPKPHQKLTYMNYYNNKRQTWEYYMVIGAIVLLVIRFYFLFHK